MSEATKSEPYLTRSLRTHSGFVLLVSAAIILTIGVTLTQVVVNYANQQERTYLLELVTAMVPGVEPQLISKLTGTAADLDKAQFQQLKSYLANLRSLNSDYRFIYLMGLQDENVVFLVDAEKENSPDYSAPGEVYPEASSELFQIFNDGRPFIEGPITDKYGEWISAHAPILNPNSGQVLAIIGVDINAKNWAVRVNTYRLFAIAITILIALVFLVFSLSLARITKSRDEIYHINADLEASLAKVKLLEGIIPICMYCKKIRDDEESWQKVENYISENSEAEFSHGICPDCYDIKMDNLSKKTE